MNIHDILTLSDNKEYVVISKSSYMNNLYLYLADINDSENFKFCLERKDGENYILDEVCDPKLMQQLIPLFCSTFISN